MENDARILIVDDTKANLDVLDELLNGEGYTVSLAPNGNIALRIASQAVPDLILLDVMMPGLNGFEVCERLQSDPRTADVPVIFITAEDDPGSVLRGFEVGGLDYIRKPFNDREVLARVRTHMKIDRLTRELSTRNEELQQANATIQAVSDRKSQFVGNLSHELRTPINAILGYAQILLRKTSLADADRRAVSTIQRSGDHLLKLINDILDISKIEAGRLELQPSDFDLQAMIQNLSLMTSIRCEARRISWDVETLGEDRIPVHGDEAKLSQVLHNLLGNAEKFTQEGGVTLRLIYEGSDRYRFEVKDTGPGVSEADRERIFEAFTQSEVGVREGTGTGLGLSISRKLLALMEGELELVSTVGEGATFWFVIELPPAKGEVIVAGGEAGEVRRLAEGQHASALIVDDVFENREVLSTLLDDVGVDIVVVDGGEAALESLKESVPDIVLMDIRMPGMDGPSTARRIWEIYGRDAMKVAAVSASTLDHERQEILAEGFHGFVSKPFRADEIYTLLEDLLGVVFEREQPIAGVTNQDIDLAGVVIPTDLLENMKRAAEIYSVSELDRYFDELDGLGDVEKRLAGHLRELRRGHNIDGILKLLGEVESGE